jgi:hypothetical protein
VSIRLCILHIITLLTRSDEFDVLVVDIPKRLLHIYKGRQHGAYDSIHLESIIVTQSLFAGMVTLRKNLRSTGYVVTIDAKEWASILREIKTGVESNQWDSAVNMAPRQHFETRGACYFVNSLEMPLSSPEAASVTRTRASSLPKKRQSSRKDRANAKSTELSVDLSTLDSMIWSFDSSESAPVKPVRPTASNSRSSPRHKRATTPSVRFSQSQETLSVTGATLELEERFPQRAYTAPARSHVHFDEGGDLTPTPVQEPQVVLLIEDDTILQVRERSCTSFIL